MKSAVMSYPYATLQVATAQQYQQAIHVYDGGALVRTFHTAHPVQVRSNPRTGKWQLVFMSYGNNFNACFRSTTFTS
jgi:hypothetical protein